MCEEIGPQPGHPPKEETRGDPTAVKALELLGRSIGMFNTTYHVTPTTEKYIDVIPEETNARIQKLIKFAQDKFDKDPDN